MVGEVVGEVTSRPRRPAPPPPGEGEWEQVLSGTRRLRDRVMILMASLGLPADRVRKLTVGAAREVARGASTGRVDVSALVARYAEVEGLGAGDLLFPSSRRQGGPLDRVSVWRILRGALDRAGVEGRALDRLRLAASASGSVDLVTGGTVKVPGPVEPEVVVEPPPKPVEPPPKAEPPAKVVEPSKAAARAASGDKMAAARAAAKASTGWKDGEVVVPVVVAREAAAPPPVAPPVVAPKAPKAAPARQAPTPPKRVEDIDAWLDEVDLTSAPPEGAKGPPSKAKAEVRVPLKDTVQAYVDMNFGKEAAGMAAAPTRADEHRELAHRILLLLLDSYGVGDGTTPVARVGGDSEGESEHLDALLRSKNVWRPESHPVWRLVWRQDGD